MLRLFPNASGVFTNAEIVEKLLDNDIRKFLEPSTTCQAAAFLTHIKVRLSFPQLTVASRCHFTSMEN